MCNNTRTHTFCREPRAPCLPMNRDEFSRYVFSLYLSAHLIERLRAAARVTELHLQGVVEQRQAAARFQDPVGLLQEERPVEPVEGRHGCHQIG